MAKQFSLSIIFQAVDRLTRPIAKMTGKFRSFRRIMGSGGTAAKLLGQRLRELGTKMGGIGRTLSTRLTLPLAAFGVLSLRTATRFRAAMNFVQAVTRTTGKEFQRLEKTALVLGRTTQFSAIQAAEAMKFLGLAGLKTNDIIEAMPKVLELAASAQLDLGSAADIVTNIMFGLSKKTSELGEVNDVLVNAFTKAKVELIGLGQAFRKAGTTLKVAGIDFRTTTALLQGLGQVGDVGGIAGRGLNRMVVELSKLKNASKKEIEILKNIGLAPTELFKVNGQLKDMVKVLKLFEGTNIDLAQATDLLGRLGGASLLKLLESGSRQINKNREGLKEIGIASRVSASQMKGLPGVFRRFLSVSESLEIAFVKTRFGKLVQRIVNTFSDWIEKLGKVNPKILELIIVLGSIAAIVGPLLIVFALITKTFALVATVPILLVFGKWITIIGVLTGVILTLKEEFLSMINAVGGFFGGVLPGGSLAVRNTLGIAGPPTRTESELILRLQVDDNIRASVNSFKPSTGLNLRVEQDRIIRGITLPDA